VLWMHSHLSFFHFVHLLPCSKSVCSNTHIDYALFFHPLPSPARLLGWCDLTFGWSDLTVYQSDHGVK